MSMPEFPPLSVLTIGAVQAECIRAHLKHGEAGGSLLNPDFPDLQKLAALVEEVGEVGRALTYDQDHAGPLVKELIQVANVALSWVESIEGAHRNQYRRPVGAANVIDAEQGEPERLAADDERKRRALLVALQAWKHEHSFMFVKQRDQEDWNEFRQHVLRVAGFDG